MHERVANVSEKAAYVSSGGTVVAGYALSDWAIIVGIVATIISVAVNWYYRHQHLQLSKAAAAQKGLDLGNDEPV